MPLNPAIPTVIGQPQTARKNVHAVHTPNPLAGLGDSLGNLGKGIGNLGLGLAAIYEERDQADYRRLLNEAEGEAIRRMNDEVYSQEGFAAEGSLERTGRIFTETMDKYSEQKSKLSRRNQQRFDEAWGSFYNNHQNQSMRHEHGNLTRAQLVANDNLIKTNVEQYTNTLDEAMLQGAVDAFRDSYRIQHGGYLVDQESLRRFDEDVNDGDGYVQVRGGAKLKIVDEEEGGKPGTITKSEIAKVRAHMEEQAKDYDRGQQNILDMAHAKVIDSYLKDNRVDEAERYLKEHSTRGTISEGMYDRAEGAVGRKREAIGEKETAEAERAAAKAEVEQNKEERKNLRRINTLLNSDKVEDAEKALQEMQYEQAKHGVFGMSDEAYEEAQMAIDRHREVLEISNEANEIVDFVQGKAGGDCIRYGGTAQDELFDAAIAKINREYTGERYQKGRQLVARVKQLRADLEEQQKNNVTSDVVANMQSMQDAKLTTPQRRDYVNKMKDSPVKTALLKACDRQEEAERKERAEYDGNTDVAFLADQRNKLNAIKMNLAKGYAKLDGVNYDLSDENPASNQGVIAYIKNLGLTSANRKKAAEYITNSKARIDALQASTELAKQLGIDSPTEALRWYPQLLDDLDEIKGTAVIEPEKMGAWLKTNIAYLLEQEATSEDGDWFWFDKEVPISDLPGVDPGDIGPENSYMTGEQLQAKRRAIRSQRALQYGDVAGAQAASGEKLTDQQLGDYARDKNMVNSKGRYYFTGGK